jgi:hypothetical protein
LLCAIVAVAGLGVPARAAPSCTTTAGVLVVVDFASLGGGIIQRCLGSVPDTGYDALHAAGFTTTGTTHDGAGFVCRINGRPTAAAEPCTDTPEASAYWSYWIGNPGSDSWRYSDDGAMSSAPRAGRIEGWSYGAGQAPRTSARSLLGASRKPGHDHDPAPGTGSRDGGAGGHRAPSATATSDATAPAGRRTSGRRSSTAAQPGTRGKESGESNDVAGVTPTSVAASGSPLWSVVAFALACLLGITAAVVARRRRMGR